MPPSVADLFTLDVASGLLTLAVAAYFVLTWRRSGHSVHLLFALGLGLKGVGYTVGSPAMFDVDRTADLRDLVRIAALTGGVVVLLAVYLSLRGRAERAGPWRFVGWGALVATGIALLLDAAYPPLGNLPLRPLSITLHVLLSVANVACALMAAAGFVETPVLSRALVPLAFSMWAVSNYTWLLIDLGAPARLGGFVHLWRLSAVLLMLLALVLPRRAGGGRGAP